MYTLIVLLTLAGLTGCVFVIQTAPAPIALLFAVLVAIALIAGGRRLARGAR